MYQLNNISYTLLSFLQNNNTSEIINKILQDILQVFKAGRAYIIEYDSEIKTQTCTFEVVDNNIEKEQTLITDLATTDNVWWTEQIMSGHSIVLSTLDDLPEEAASEKNFSFTIDKITYRRTSGISSGSLGICRNRRG